MVKKAKNILTKSRFCIPSGIIVFGYASINFLIYEFVISKRNFRIIDITFVFSAVFFFAVLFAFLLVIAFKDSALKKTEKQYRTLFNSVGDPVMVFPYAGSGLSKNFIDVNGESVYKLGYFRNEFLGLSPVDIIVKTDHGRVSALLGELSEKKNITYETQHITKDGRIFEVEVRSSLMELGGESIVICVSRDITHRKALEREIFELYEERKDFVQDLPIGVYKASLDPEGCFLDVNSEMVKIFEAASEDELLKVKIKDLYVNPDERNTLINNVAKEKRLDLVEEKRRTLKGKIIDINMSVKLIEDGKNVFEGVLEDITQRKALEQSLAKNEELFRTIAHNMPNGVMLHREDIIYANPKIIKIFGFGEEELYGMKIWDIFEDEADKTMIKSFAERRLKGEMFEVDHMHRTSTKDGKRLDIWVHATTILYEGKWTDLTLVTDYTKMAVTEEKMVRERDEFRNLSEHDALTGLFNRRMFEDKLTHSINLSYRYKRHLSLAMLDIDRFKKINDGFGHVTGDRVLVELTEAVKSVLRSSDVLSRFGGEEFMIIMPETDIKNAATVTERIRKKVEAHKFNNDIGFLSVSIGVTQFREDDEMESFIQRTDDALYAAKEKGRNRVEII